MAIQDSDPNADPFYPVAVCSSFRPHDQKIVLSNTESMMVRNLRAAITIVCLALAGSSQATFVSWSLDLGPTSSSNSITDGLIQVTIDTAPTLVIDRAADRGWYSTQRPVTDGTLLLDGEEFIVTDGVVSQTQCWDTAVFSNPGCTYDLDRFVLFLNLTTGGYLELTTLASPDNAFGSLAGINYPFWQERPLVDLTSPLLFAPQNVLFSQGIRDPFSQDPTSFSFSLDSWAEVSTPPTALLILSAIASVAFVRLVR